MLISENHQFLVIGKCEIKGISNLNVSKTITKNFTIKLIKVNHCKKMCESPKEDMHHLLSQNSLSRNGEVHFLVWKLLKLPRSKLKKAVPQLHVG